MTPAHTSKVTPLPSLNWLSLAHERFLLIVASVPLDAEQKYPDTGNSYMRERIGTLERVRRRMLTNYVVYCLRQP